MTDAAAAGDFYSDQNPEHGYFWQQARLGKLVTKRCRACGKAHWYPRAICPHCGSSETEWIECSGRGEIYSYSAMRRGDPYVIAFVRLAEGTTMLTNLVECDPDRIAIGQQVAVRFIPQASGIVAPMFAPA